MKHVVYANTAVASLLMLMMQSFGFENRLILTHLQYLIEVEFILWTSKVAFADDVQDLPSTIVERAFKLCLSKSPECHDHEEWDSLDHFLSYAFSNRRKVWRSQSSM